MKLKNSKREPAANGFTLVELLVVIAIIAVSYTHLTLPTKA